jgi:hypothetical protein
MGDLSARRTDRSPGAFHADAAPFDASVTEAFRSAAPDRLLALDPAQAADLLVAGRVPLQVLAGAFESPRVGSARVEGALVQRDPAQDDPGRGDPGRGDPAQEGPAWGDPAKARARGRGDPAPQAPGRADPAEEATRRGGPALRGRVLYDDAPYGVGYLVALLTAP